MHSFIKSSIEAAEVAGQKFYLNSSSRFLGLHSGSMFGRNTGSSLEFFDHREYQLGDDIRHIDWNTVARNDRLTVKLFREEIAPHLDILIDGSKSMSDETLKKNAATFALAAMLRIAAYNAGYSVHCWIIKDNCLRVEPVSLPPTTWTDTELDFCGNIGDTIINFPPSLKPTGVRVLISDLFWNQEPMTVLQQLSDGATGLIVIQMLSEQDITPQLYGNIRLIDSETSEAVEFIASESLITEYRRNFTRHQDYWKKCCTSKNTVFSYSISEQFLDDYMPDELIKTDLLMVRS